MAPALAPAVLNGHISGWVTRPAEQELLDLVGMDAALPRVTTSGTDAIAVVNINRNANKIDSFLERTIEYRPVVNQNSGEATATLVVSLTNTAPTTGYDDYVIGNRVDLPIGTNRTFLDVSSRLGVDAARVDGEDIAPYTLPELGYNVHSSVVIVPPGEAPPPAAARVASTAGSRSWSAASTRARLRCTLSRSSIFQPRARR